ARPRGAFERGRNIARRRPLVSPRAGWYPTNSSAGGPAVNDRIDTRNRRVDAPSGRVVSAVTMAALAMCGMLATPSAAQAQPAPASGRDVYLRACAACHGDAGTGRSPIELGFDVPMP